MTILGLGYSGSSVIGKFGIGKYIAVGNKAADAAETLSETAAKGATKVDVAQPVGTAKGSNSFIDFNLQLFAEGPTKATGARALSVEEYFKREAQATEMYKNIRNSTDDVSNIAKNTGMSEERVQRIKDHLFNREHVLPEGKGQFAPDYDMAQAWNRLKEGNHIQSDIDLLNHELFESKFEGIFKTSYETAHSATNKSGRTWTPDE